MKKVLLCFALLFLMLLVPLKVFAEEEGEEEVIEKEQVDEVDTWFNEFFSAEKVAMYISWIAYIGTIIGLVVKVKQLKTTNGLTLKDVNENVKGVISLEVAQKFEKYLPCILATQEKTNEIMSIFAKILALSQENTPESKVAILNLIQDLGVVSKEIIDNAKQVIDDVVKQEKEHKEEINNEIDKLIEEYNGTSVDY